MAKNNTAPQRSDMNERADNARQMKLVNRIDKLKWKLDMTSSYLRIYQEHLAETDKKKVGELDNRISRSLRSLERQCADEEKLYQDLCSHRLPKYDEQAALDFRACRQTLRRNEGVVDKTGRVIEGKTLSAESEKTLEAYQADAAKKREAFLADLKKQAKAACLPAEKRAELQKNYDKAMADKQAALEALAAKRKVKSDAQYARFAAKSNKKIEKLNEDLPVLQAQLNEQLSENAYGLPDNVVLRLDHLGIQFGGLKAVNDLCCDVLKGEIFGLIGPNGAGKTTVFNCITQFYKPTTGEVYYRNKEGKVLSMNSYKVHDVIKTGIVRTFQNVEVIAELSILQNLLIAAHTQYKSSIFAQMVNARSVRQEEAVINRKALDVLEYCGLTALKDYPPVGMPYGILKRIELARTLMAGANLIILDEPAAGLNDNETLELAALIRKIRDEYNVTIFLVEHDMGLVMDICDHICAISFGKKLAYGTPAEIQADPAVQEAYLGTAEKEEEKDIEAVPAADDAKGGQA